MIRVRLIFAVYILVACASALLYRTSYAVDELKGQLSQLNREIVAEQENIQVLGAEWTYLCEPTRIEQLAAKYLKMEATKVQRVAAVSDMGRVIGNQEAPVKTAAAPVATPAAKPVQVAVAAQRQAAPVARPVQMVAYKQPQRQPLRTTTVAAKTTTPNQVKLLLASFQPGRDMIRE